MSLWYRQLQRGSQDTADNYLKRLGRFCEENGTTPKSYLGLPKKQREDRLIRYIDNLSTILNPATREPYAPSYIGTYVKAVQSYAKFCGKKLERVPKVHNQDSTPTLKDEKTFLQEEFGRFLYAPSTTIRVRASIILIALAGARPGTQGNKRGTDGLLVGDLPDLEIVTDELGKREVKFKNIPARLVVRASISKCRHEYFTFICQEGCMILKAYLDKRLEYGEKLTKESALIVALPDERARVSYLNHVYKERKFLSTASIRRGIREALRKSGISMRAVRAAVLL